uniref:UBP26 n=1 Tax=Arundo donax TaxID=35708 RepID=A0A0A9D1U7_ARUDO
MLQCLEKIFLHPWNLSLEAIVSSLICEKHSRLLQRPLDLVCKRESGSFTQKTSNTDGLTMIPEYGWKLFSEWSAALGKGISAEISFTKSSQHTKLHESVKQYQLRMEI